MDPMPRPRFKNLRQADGHLVGDVTWNGGPDGTHENTVFDSQIYLEEKCRVETCPGRVLRSTILLGSTAFHGCWLCLESVTVPLRAGEENQVGYRDLAAWLMRMEEEAQAATVPPEEAPTSPATSSVTSPERADIEALRASVADKLLSHAEKLGLVLSLIRQRGERGTDEEVVQAALQWANHAALQRWLLDLVLQGKVGLDVDADGEPVFCHIDNSSEDS